MSQIKRYVADQTANGDPMVLDTGHDPARVICGCRSDEDAELIARALNARAAAGAIDAAGPTCNRCGVTYVPEGEGQTCGEPYCNGRVTWEATVDRLASQLRGEYPE
jgi:hypothetical protein